MSSRNSQEPSDTPRLSHKVKIEIGESLSTTTPETSPHDTSEDSEDTRKVSNSSDDSVEFDHDAVLESDDHEAQIAKLKMAMAMT